MGGLITIVKRSAQSFGSDKCTTLAAAIAYRTVFSLFPMALVGVSILGFFVEDETARRQVIQGISSFVALGGEAEDELGNMLQGVSQARGLLGILGLLTAIWSASALFGEIRSALNSVWDVDRPRPMLRAKAQDILLFFGFGGLIVASTASTGILQGARAAGAQWLGPLTDLAGPVFALLIFLAPFTLTFLAFLFLNRFAPHAQIGWRDVLPAAIVASIFFEFGKNILAYYITNLGNFNALAGSLGAAILFLVFVYYAAQIILFGAELAKHQMLVREGTLPATDPKPEKADVPLIEKAKGSLVQLWSVGERHHDSELPYEPGRLDPHTNRPSNTREEVLLKQQQSLQHASGEDGQPARRDAGVAARHQTEAMSFAAGAAIVRGRLRREGDAIIVQSGGHAHRLNAGSEVQVTRNGEPAALGALHTDDWVSIKTDEKGMARRIDARTTPVHPAPGPSSSEVWKLMGFVAALVLSILLKWRDRDAGEDRGQEHQSRRLRLTRDSSR